MFSENISKIIFAAPGVKKKAPTSKEVRAISDVASGFPKDVFDYP